MSLSLYLCQLEIMSGTHVIIDRVKMNTSQPRLFIPLKERAAYCLKTCLNTCSINSSSIIISNLYSLHCRNVLLNS